jgi:hypothetical protein
MLLEQCMGAQSFRVVLGRFRKFFIVSKNDDACPCITIPIYFIHFHADLGIGAHPLHFLARRREAIKVSPVVHKVERNSVRLVLSGTRESAEPGVGESVKAVTFREFLN